MHWQLKRSLYLLIALLIISILILVLPRPAAAAENRHQFMADVNSDTYDDALTFDSKTGDWWLAPANSGSANFLGPIRLISGFGVGSSKQFVADVTGDGRADAVTFDAATGDWWVAPVTQAADMFTVPSRWIHGHGVGSTNQMLADVNGDGKADATAFFSNGSWSVATTNINSNGFDAPGLWFIGGHGVGSTRQFISDVTGDGKADAIVWNNKSADWWVSNSDGIHFATGPTRWARGVGLGSSDQFLVDVNEDSRADIIMAFPGPSSQYGGQWWTGISNGNGFNSAILWHSGFGYGVANVIPGDTYGTFATDMVTFDAINGDWWVMQSTDSAFTPAGAQWKHGFGVGT